MKTKAKLHDRHVWRRLTALAQRTLGIVSVAYLGRGGAAQLPLRKGSTLVVNLSMQTVKAGITAARRCCRRRTCCTSSATNRDGSGGWSCISPSPRVRRRSRFRSCASGSALRPRSCPCRTLRTAAGSWPTAEPSTRSSTRSREGKVREAAARAEAPWRASRASRAASAGRRPAPEPRRRASVTAEPRGRAAARSARSSRHEPRRILPDL